MTTSPDRRIRVFWFLSGKLRLTYDESLEVWEDRYVHVHLKSEHSLKTCT